MGVSCMLYGAGWAMSTCKGRRSLRSSSCRLTTAFVECSGSASQALLDDTFKDAVAKPFASLEDAMLDLAEGKVDAVLADKFAASDFLKSRREGQQCCRFLGDAPRDQAIFGEGLGIAFRKSDVALREATDAALQSTIEDGTFARISAKYFDFPVR